MSTINMSAPLPPRTRAMSSIRRPTSTSSSTTTTTSSSARSRSSLGGPGSEQTTPRSSLSSHRPRSSISMYERPSSLGGRGLVEQSASGMARPSPLSSRPLPPGRSTSGGSKRGSPIPPEVLSDTGTGGTSDALEASLRREVEEKEELMMRLAHRDDAIAQLESRIVEMNATMTQGEGQLAELYADQERWEAERAGLERSIAKKTTIIDKLRIQLRELEKENKDYTRRLTEQAAQFESERQAFYDNTAHLKSRIQSLTDQQRELKERQREEEEANEKGVTEDVVEEETNEEVQEDTPVSETGLLSPKSPRARRPFPRKQDRAEDRGEPVEPAEMSALRLELSTLNTSHGSLGQTVKMLQGQLADLQRVNLTLQEENEAFTTLLKEKTLSGQIDILRRTSRSPSPAPSEHEHQEEEAKGPESGLLFPTQSPPPRVRTQSRALKPRRDVSPARSARSGKSARGAKRVVSETLADLPVAGPGLDLAAELGRAEFRLEDDLGQEPEGEADAKPDEKKEEEPKKDETTISNAELEAIKAEVKHLKDANKALTLYASKIIDRIIAQEAFEHILAVDYTRPEEKKEKPKPAPAPAPVKSFLQRAASLSISGGAPPVLASRPPLKIATDAANASTAGGLDSPGTPMSKRDRRGMSMDWSRLNPFSKAPATPIEDVRTSGLKPLALGRTLSTEPPMPATPKDTEPVVLRGGRKLDNQEDEEDRIERERLNAEMKLMGIERGPSVHTPAAGVTSFAAAGSALALSDSKGADSRPTTPSLSGMISGWGKRPAPARQDSSTSNRVSMDSLKAEHLELGDDASQHSAEYETREVESRIAKLEEKEKHLSAEMAKGKGGGFTEPPSRGARVRRRGSNGSAASTLFSAGRISRGGSEAGTIGEEDEPGL